MLMIDVYASEATFAHPHDLAREPGGCGDAWEQAPDILTTCSSSEAQHLQLATAATISVDSFITPTCFSRSSSSGRTPPPSCTGWRQPRSSNVDGESDYIRV
jgi:hypothetical protein